MDQTPQTDPASKPWTEVVRSDFGIAGRFMFKWGIRVVVLLSILWLITASLRSFGGGNSNILLLILSILALVMIAVGVLVGVRLYKKRASTTKSDKSSPGETGKKSTPLSELGKQKITFGIIVISICLAVLFAEPKFYSVWVANNGWFAAFIVVGILLWGWFTPPKSFGLFYFVLVGLVLWGVYGRLPVENRDAVNAWWATHSSSKNVEEVKQTQKTVFEEKELTANPYAPTWVNFPKGGEVDVKAVSFVCHHGCHVVIQHLVKRGDELCGDDGIYKWAEEEIRCKMSETAEGPGQMHFVREDFMVPPTSFSPDLPPQKLMPKIKQLNIGFLSPSLKLSSVPISVKWTAGVTSVN